MTGRALSVTAVEGLPEIRAGDDLAALIGDALAMLEPIGGDIIAVAQKVVSKAEGRLVRLETVQPSQRAEQLAREADKDPRVMQLLLDESAEVLRVRRGVVIVEDVRGLVMANAGIDRSNLEADDTVLLLPVDPNASARRLRESLEQRFGAGLGVIVTDSFGRAWRRGVLGTAIGASGVECLIDARGRPDRSGRPLQVTEIGAGDALAAAAALVIGEGAEGSPCALLRGWPAAPDAPGFGALLRPRAEDLFR